MKDLDVFLSKISLNAPGVSAPVAYSAIRDAAIEFCTRTHLWRWEDDFTVTFADGEDISAPLGAELLSIEQVLFDGRPLEPKTVQWLDEHYTGWRTGAIAGAPSYFAQIEPGTMRVAPFATGTVNVYGKLKPSQNCQQLPDFMADLYRSEIAWGALGELLLQPNQPYTNLQMAAVFRARFVERMDSLKALASRGQQGARIRGRISHF